MSGRGYPSSGRPVSDLKPPTTGGVRGDVRKRTAAPSPVVLTEVEFEALAEAAYAGGRGAWISKAEIKAFESIIAARLAGA